MMVKSPIVLFQAGFFPINSFACKNLILSCVVYGKNIFQEKTDGVNLIIFFQLKMSVQKLKTYEESIDPILLMEEILRSPPGMYKTWYIRGETTNLNWWTPDFSYQQYEPFKFPSPWAPQTHPPPHRWRRYLGVWGFFYIWHFFFRRGLGRFFLQINRYLPLESWGPHPAYYIYIYI